MRDLLTPQDMIHCGKRRHRRLTDNQVIAVARALDDIDKEIMSKEMDAPTAKAA